MLKLSQTTAASFLLCQLILKPTEMDGLLIRKFERSRGFFVVNSTDSCAIFGSVGASYQPGKVKEQRAPGVTVKSRKSGLISKSSGGNDQNDQFLRKTHRWRQMKIALCLTGVID